MQFRAASSLTRLPMALLSALCVVAAGSPSAEAAAVELVLRVTVPASTPPGDAVHLAGDFQGWDPASAAHRLAPVGEQVHEIGLSFEPGTRIEFKFTRGSWATVEKGPSGEELANRVLTVSGPRVVELTVANWADLIDSGHTVVGDVTQTTVPGFLDSRRVWVYLPPGYHESERAHPLLVMLDGQNVFDAATSFAGEWEMDETCERLIAEGDIEPLVVVAVDNAGAGRIDEYTPWPAPDGRGGGGAAHLEAIVEVLLPWVRDQYRVRTDPAGTGLGGSSLGGLMACYAALAHGGTFGRIAALSPSIWWADHALVDFVAGGQRPEGSRVWTDMGTRERGTLRDEDGNGVDDFVDDLRALREEMIAAGYELGETLVALEDEGASHDERAWRARLPAVLRFLFPARTGVGSPAPTMGEWKGSW